jgi:hypothetical protein
VDLFKVFDGLGDFLVRIGTCLDNLNLVGLVVHLLFYEVDLAQDGSCIDVAAVSRVNLTQSSNLLLESFNLLPMLFESTSVLLEFVVS